MTLHVRSVLRAAGLIASLAFSSFAHSQETVKVGAVLSLSGPSATVGEDVRRAVELAVDRVNANGGVGGKRFVVIIEDSAGNATTAIGAARKLTSVDKVPVVLGEYSSGITVPMGQYLVKEGVVHVNVASTSVKVRELGASSFNLVGLEDRGGKFAASDSYGLGMRNVAIIAPNNAHGQGTALAFKEEFEKLGGKVAGEVLYTAGQPSYRRELQQLERRKPDGYVYTAYGQEAAVINREAHELGLRSKPWYAILLSNAISDTPPNIAQGQLGMELGSFKGPAGEAYTKAFTAKYNDVVRSSFSAYAYDGVMMVAKAIEMAKSTAPADVQAAMVKLGAQGFEGVTGLIKFDQLNQRIDPPYAKLRYDAGKVVPR